MTDVPAAGALARFFAPSDAPDAEDRREWPTVALALAAGWIALYLPAYADFATDAWRQDRNAHAPFILAICFGTAWARLDARRRAWPTPSTREVAAGVGVLGFGLSFFILGRIAEAALVVSATQTFVAAGLVLATFGVAGARGLWFPLALSIYLWLWPSWVIDALTFPLKMFVSSAVADMMYALGEPVAHSGATLSAGPYRLLVADACAGLNSLVALTSVGAVYLYAARRPSLTANAIVLLALAPVAVLANVLRVALLVLITLHLGYDAGQSFLHDSAGIVMFAAALALVFIVDAVASAIFKGAPRAAPAAPLEAPVRSAPKRLAALLLAAMLAAAALSAGGAARGTGSAPAAPDLEALLPDAFGRWRRTPLADVVLPAESELAPGEAVVYRAYTDDLGRTATLVVAYGPPLGDGVRLHRPERCYVAQGFSILSRRIGAASGVAPGGASTPVVHMATEDATRREAVSYVLRDGSDFVVAAPERQLNVFRRLVGGASADGAARADGALVRISTVYGAAPDFDVHEDFLEAFAGGLSAPARVVVFGGPAS